MYGGIQQKTNAKTLKNPKTKAFPNKPDSETPINKRQQGINISIF